MARFDDMLADLGASAAIPGVMGVGGGRTWDAVVATHAPALTGDRVTFVTLDDGTLIVNENIPDGALSPVADQLEEMVEPRIAPPRRGARTTSGQQWPRRCGSWSSPASLPTKSSSPSSRGSAP